MKNGRTMSVWVGGLEGGCSKACLFRFFYSYLCILVNHLYGFLEPRLIICPDQHNRRTYILRLASKIQN